MLQCPGLGVAEILFCCRGLRKSEEGVFQSQKVRLAAPAPWTSAGSGGNFSPVSRHQVN